MSISMLYSICATYLTLSINFTYFLKFSKKRFYNKGENEGKRQIKGRVDRYEKIVVERIEMFHHY